MINKEIQDNQRDKLALLHRIQELNQPPHQDQANEQKSSTAESKEKGKNEDEKQEDKEEATTETKTPGKRKILPSTGQETSYLALFGVAVATMSLAWYKKKKTTH